MNHLIYDAHFHIIDPRFPLQANQGYLPEAFTVTDYKKKIEELNLTLTGGTIVSGSFQAFDQGYLLHALQVLGENFVGIINLPYTTSDAEIKKLHNAGVRGVRFNLFRGGSENMDKLKEMAIRIDDLCGWHVELYVDSNDLKDLSSLLLSLPKVSIDHLGLSKKGFHDLVYLVENGVFVKATGFMRTDFDILPALKTLYKANPNALLFGTDLPGTRAKRQFNRDDLKIIQDNFDANAVKKITIDNARFFYAF